MGIPIASAALLASLWGGGFPPSSPVVQVEPSVNDAPATVATVMARSPFAQAPLRETWNLGLQSIVGIGFLLGTGAAIIGIRQYLIYQKWRRQEYARQLVDDFRNQPGVKNVIHILDYEEYRCFQHTLPNGKTLTFEATDARLRRALRSHDQMVKMRRGLNLLQRPDIKDSKLNDNTAAVLDKYESEEFPIEIALRDWFDDFLMGLEQFENKIQAGLLSAHELKPFIIYWIQLIGDRRFRRQGGSGFYDQLFHYIYWAGYSGVRSLFHRYGYRILPPPYHSSDFDPGFEKLGGRYDAERALCLAKAAYLVYEDYAYIQDIIRYWLENHMPWQEMEDHRYVIDVLNRWLQEDKLIQKVDLSEHLHYFDMPRTNTQAMLFRKGNQIILAFRGSQQLADWGTNFNFKMRPFKVAMSGAQVPSGRVHAGFQGAWESIEAKVLLYLRDWCKPGKPYHLWVTGHSLGGALAALAGISLHYQGYTVSGLYTFGQPRVGDWEFARKVNAEIGDRVFRYVNNNDVVPLIPLTFNILSPTRLYGHFGQFRYFNTFGTLRMTSFPTQRWADRLLGWLLVIPQPGTDFVSDHMMEFYIRHLQKAYNAEQEEARIKAEIQAYEVVEITEAKA